MIDRLVYGIDQLSKSIGHSFAWCIVILTFGTSYEVFVRYALNNPTSWAFDFSYLMYGALFFMAGAYTLSRGGHVRGDFIYRMWRPRTQGTVDLVLYLLFYFPGVLALVIAGWPYGMEAFRLREVSVNSPVGIPIWQLKLLIPFGAALLALQGFAEVLALHPVHSRWPVVAATARRRGTGRRAGPAARRRSREAGGRSGEAGERAMSDPVLALVMLGLFIVVIMLGFPIAFTLMGMAVGFGFYAYFRPGQDFFDNRLFYLLTQNTWSIMSNDVLVAVPLFLFMGYVIERSNILDRLFYSLQVALRHIPGSMAVAALLTCAMFATATGIVGAVVTLMGLLAFPVMLKAGYDQRLSAGVICAGGTLGILIPPSIMLIVYSAAASVSVVRLYAAALIPGFLLAGLYVVYVITRVVVNPKLAPKLPKEETDVTWTKAFLLLAAGVRAALRAHLRRCSVRSCSGSRRPRRPPRSAHRAA